MKSKFVWTKFFDRRKVKIMKRDSRPFEIVALLIAAFVNATTVHSQQFPLLTLGNAVPTNSPPVTNATRVANGVANDTHSVIEFRDVPMSAVIEHLARQAGINYMIDGRLTKWWSIVDLDGNAREPVLNFRWENLTAKQALLQLLKEYNFVLLEDPFTSIARITYINQVINPAEASLMGSETNFDDANGEEMRFQDIPITTVLENLARQAGINYALDPEIGYGLPDKNGRIKPEPEMSFWWHNVTPKQGIIAVCENYGFILVKIPASGIYLIRAKDHPLTNFIDASLLGSDTNDATTFRFQDVPLDKVFENLIKLGHVNAVLDPTISSFDSSRQFPSTSTVSLRWENVTPQQVIIALCENYDLTVVKDSATGVIRIKPKN